MANIFEKAKEAIEQPEKEIKTMTDTDARKQYEADKKIATKGYASAPYMSFEQWQKNNNVQISETENGKEKKEIETATGGRVVPPETDTKTKKTLPEGSSSGTDTVPIAEPVQKEIDTSNDATRQEKAQIKEAADGAKDYVKENNLVDVAKEASDKYNLYTQNIDTHYTDGLPRTIIQAWKNGRFGEPETKDAKKIRNALLANEVGTMLSNMGAGINGGEKKEGLWTASVRKNMEEADKRNNEKFETTMKDQLAQYNLSADEQIELEKHINEVMADSTLAVAAKHANNIEDTIGLWHLRQALGEEWSKMSKKQQRDFLNAVNAAQNGDTASAKAILQTSLSDEEYNKIQQNMATYSQQQAKANADIASKDASVRGVQNAMGIVNNTLSALGTIGDVILP